MLVNCILIQISIKKRWTRTGELVITQAKEGQHHQMCTSSLANLQNQLSRKETKYLDHQDLQKGLSVLTCMPHICSKPSQTGLSPLVVLQNINQSQMELYGHHQFLEYLEK